MSLEKINLRKALFSKLSQHLRERKNLGKFGLKTSFKKKTTKVHTTRDCRICLFQIGKIISGIGSLKL